VSGQCSWEDSSCKTDVDSSHHGVAPGSNNDDDDKENVRSCRLGDRDQHHLSHTGQCWSFVVTQICYRTLVH